MDFPTSALVVVHLMATLCVITLSEVIPLTCPDTARRQLKDISKIFNCTPFVREDGVPICDGAVSVGKYPLLETVYITLTFKMLKEVPEGTAICVGLRKLFAKRTMTVMFSDMRYRLDFNPLLAVGILMVDHNTSKTNRSCSIRLLSDVLKLTIMSHFNAVDSSFWDFSSPFFGTQLNWFQGLYIHSVFGEMRLIWLEKLQNTSIQSLKVSDTVEEPSTNKTILLKDMPFVREIMIHGAFLEEFHQDSFLGMPEMEALIIQITPLTGIPEMINRMPKLKILEISGGPYGPINYTIPRKELSTLKNLQVLNIKYNMVYSISGKLPPFSKLRVLNLEGCVLSSIEESDFMGYPVLEDLYLSNNMLTHLKDNTFRPLKRMKLLDLSHNNLTNWPVLYDFSFVLLDVSYNLLSDVYNLGNARTTVEVLNISHNTISEWNDKYVFSLQKSLISNDDQRKKVNMSHSEGSNKKNIFTLDSTKPNQLFKNLGLSTTQRAELNITSHSGSHRKIFNRIPVNLSLVNFDDQIDLPKNDNGAQVTVNNFENTIEYSSLMMSEFWVMKIDISSNLISGLSETMMQSLDGIHEVDLGGNQFDCVDCRMIPFQKWLNTTSTTVSNFDTSDPLLCSSPVSQRGTPVNLVQYDEEPCSEKIRHTSLLMLIGVPVGVMSILVFTVTGGIYKFRSEIGYMLHLYKIRQRARAFSQSVFNKYAFDAFICYSCKDRRFVLTRLAPLLEKGQERYCLCLHERDFPLGSHIVSNIVGSIQHSRKTIIVLSEHFIDSKWCNWELEMANHKMFNEDEHFLILIQLGKLDRNKLPRHLLFLMDTRTYLEWPPVGHKDEEQVVQRLKSALGPSIFQNTNEKAPSLSEVMEQY